MTSWFQGFFGGAGKAEPNPVEPSEAAQEMDEAPLEPEQASLEDSNIAGIGGEENRELRKAAAETEVEYKGAGSKVGLEVWRVENKRTASDTPDFGIKRVNKQDFGTFFAGDSYIVLNTYHPKDPLTGKVMDRLAWDLHFWLGKESTQDEKGVAAYKTVELDDLLDDGPVQHRETQFNESKLFQSYFKEVTYLRGGHASGFRTVKPEEYEPRFFMVRSSRRSARAFEIDVAVGNMNHGDVFVLDTGRKVYLWEGEESNHFERNKGGLLQSNLISGRNGKAVKAVADDEFWEVLGGSEEDVRPADDPFLPDELVEATTEEKLDRASLKLFCISDASGSIEFSQVDEGNSIEYRELQPEDVFLVHSNIGIWIWIGSRASQNEKSKAMAIADQYISNEGLPESIPVVALREDVAMLNHLFISLFKF